MMAGKVVDARCGGRIHAAMRVQRSCFIVLCAVLAGGCGARESAPVGEDGPSFLLLGTAATQVGGDTVKAYVQARGGDHVSIVTHGGTHRVAGLAEDAQASCVALPGTGPLYVLVTPAAPDCVVEVRLYQLCDDASVGGSTPPLTVCEGEGMFIASDTLVVRGNAAADAGVLPIDGGRDE